MSFRSNAIAMLTGTVMAQAIPLLCSPLLARLYTPEAFGLQTLFMALAAGLAVLATCRFDLAMVLPKNENHSYSLASVVVCLTGVVCGIVWVVLLIASADLNRLSGRADSTAWLWGLPPMVAGIVLLQILVAFATRERNFKAVAKANVLNQAGYVFVALVIGAFGAWTQGLVFSKLAGQWVCIIILVLLYGSSICIALGRASWCGMKRVVTVYRQFLFFNTPYSLIGTIARDAPIFIFSAFSMTGAAGQYGLARMLLLAPTLLTSNALSQVYFREAVALKGQPRLQELTLGLLRLGLWASAPMFAFCAIWGDELFVTIFGETWRLAGTFAMLVAPAAWMAVQTGWPERLFEVNMRQAVSFVVQLSADFITAVVFATVFILTRDIVVAIAAFAICNIFYHHIFLIAIFNVSKFSLVGLGRVLGQGWLAFGLSCLVLAALKTVAGHGIAIAIVAAAASCVAALVIANPLWRRALVHSDS